MFDATYYLLKLDMEEDDQLLSRARALIEATNLTNQQLQSVMPTGHSTASPISSPSKKGGTAGKNSESSFSSSRSNRSNLVSEDRIFKGAAINGSSLVTTVGDARLFLTPGQTITIDDTPCIVSRTTGEAAPPNRILLDHDYR